MKRRKDLSEHILASLSDGVVVLDPACRVVIFNPAMEEMTGVSSRRAAGEALATLLPKKSPIPARVISTMVRRNPSLANSRCARSFFSAVPRMTRGAPCSRSQFIAASIRAVAVPARAGRTNQAAAEGEEGLHDRR